MIDFSEDCTYYGDVDISFDWSGLLKGDTKPNEMQAVFYTESYPEKIFKLYGDTLLKEIQEGQYNVLAYNSAEGISITGNGKEGVKTSLPVYRQNGKDYTVQAPLLYAAQSDVFAKAFETSHCKLLPQSCTQKIGIDFVVIRENLDSEVINLSGELNGISTGFDLSELTPIDSYAILPFKSTKLQLDNFRTDLQVFGLSANGIKALGSSNKLELSLLMSDGTVFNQYLDLTDTFRGFTSGAIHLTLEIRLSAIGMTVSLTDWYLVDQGEIEV